MSGMRQLRDLSGKINQEFEAMTIEFRRYQAESGLGCLAECGKCCLNPEIEATQLEMLPMALDLYDRGMALETLEQIEQGRKNCVAYNPTSEDGQKGFCRSYTQRPSICRMFGAAGYSNKQGKNSLSVCSLIKKAAPVQYENALAQASLAPKMSAWSAKVLTLDPVLGAHLYPINEALKKMILKILMIASYDGGDDPRPIIPSKAS